MVILSSVKNNEGHSVEKRKEDFWGNNNVCGLGLIPAVDRRGMKMERWFGLREVEVPGLNWQVKVFVPCFIMPLIFMSRVLTVLGLWHHPTNFSLCNLVDRRLIFNISMPMEVHPMCHD